MSHSPHLSSVSTIANGWMNGMQIGLTCAHFTIPQISEGGELTREFVSTDRTAQLAGGLLSTVYKTVGKKSAGLFHSEAEGGSVVFNLHDPLDIAGDFFVRNIIGDPLAHSVGSFHSITGRTANGNWNAGISTRKVPGFLNPASFHYSVEASAISKAATEAAGQVIKGLKANIFRDEEGWHPIQVATGIHWIAREFQVEQQLRGEHQRMSIAIRKADEALIRSTLQALRNLGELLARDNVPNPSLDIISLLEAGEDITQTLEYGREPKTKINLEARADGTFEISQEWPASVGSSPDSVFDYILHAITSFAYEASEAHRAMLPLVFGVDRLEESITGHRELRTEPPGDE